MMRRAIRGPFRATAGAVAILLSVAPLCAVAQDGSTLSATTRSDPGQDLPEPVLHALREALATYEEARGHLVADRLKGASASASRLAGALRSALEASGDLESEAAAMIEQAASGAASLARSEDLAAARVAFGEASRGLLALATSDGRLVEGWHLFACPMVDSFPRWIQPTEPLENPYMGQAMPACGFAADWPAPARVAEHAPDADRQEPPTATTRPEPEFKPGIPGLKMVDVRDHKFLWREIEELQRWERGDRITVAEYRSKAIEKTVHFLELEDAAADDFVSAASAAITGVRAAFFAREARAETSGVEGRFSSELEAVTVSLTSRLGDQPRHRLFAPGCKKWLLKLAFGPSETKEAREAKQAKESGRI